MAKLDPCSAALDDCICTALDLSLTADFGAKTLVGAVVYSIQRKPEATALVLDCRDLTVTAVSIDGSDTALKFEIAEVSAAFGQRMTVALPADLEPGQKIRVTYATSPEATGIQWLPTEQTADKTHPFLFTQCQAIHARSLLPCQDTPAVKCAYTAHITVPAALTALMSAVPDGDKAADDGLKEYAFKQEVPIPSYLIAIVIGALESRDIGPRSKVWAEPSFIERSAFEFAETEKMLATAEELLGPYVWGRYDVLVLPPSFPYGGMENPTLTFVTPTLLAGDRSLANVVAHEIAHSWTGNLVTNKTWEHFWLNEGFTVFVERKILGRMFGEPTRQFAGMLGMKALIDSVQAFGADNPLTALCPKLEGIDPDDSFSSVPYEKGFNLLFYLESLLGGPEAFEPYLRAYVDEFKYKSITTDQWKTFLYLQFPDKHAVLDAVDWNMWLFAPGLPTVENKFDQTLAEAAFKLADQWSTATEYSAFKLADIEGFQTQQKNALLDRLLLREPLSTATIMAMDKAYKFSESINSEIRFRWQRLCLKAEWKPILPKVAEFVIEQGRMKFVRPLYRELNAWDEGKALARETFVAHRKQYHIIASQMIAKDLGL